MEKQVKSKKRVADHGEVFTAEREVNAMLDLVKHETERIESTFLEPACGNGNFLAEILRRKLAIVDQYKRFPSDWERYSVVAMMSIYGVDILPDNVAECRERLYSGLHDRRNVCYPAGEALGVCSVGQRGQRNLEPPAEQSGSVGCIDENRGLPQLECGYPDYH